MMSYKETKSPMTKYLPISTDSLYLLHLTTATLPSQELSRDTFSSFFSIGTSAAVELLISPASTEDCPFSSPWLVCDNPIKTAQMETYWHKCSVKIADIFSSIAQTVPKYTRQITENLVPSPIWPTYEKVVWEVLTIITIYKDKRQHNTITNT